ncbi:hypothetical protein HYDPIDRAFT_113724 [Hydnomerulius pinastri MD-312]|uniref:RING-type domain-containing protein n=1 Tax=Hydnomerulius pinastri MD-312 TaxID=994086 RepID=A0A0C9WDL9_9AGAM|nr:hypothetical protein HYDPIDRAFT_113724 [Hydnomerulius pinastri MD-312]
MHKHSLSVPLVPASAPTSPATARLNRTERDFGSPVTPQRVVRSQKTSYRSPATPASTHSPYTPLSLRSISTNSSSTITTPGSATSIKRFLTIHSPENEPITKLTDKSLADMAVNWRSRGLENAIKVTTTEDSSFGDDEGSDLTPSDAHSTVLANEEALILPPFLPNHRRSRTQSSIHPQCAPVSPQMHRTPARRTLGILNTPPPKPTNSNQLKFKGSFTDPAHTRRRPSFGQISTELFDIDEDAFEPYPQSFSSTAQTIVLQDPFNGSGLSTIAETVPQHFHSPYSEMFNKVAATPPLVACSVCGRSGGRLAILEPCKHPLCSACLTSALNIVGEKDMECSVCKTCVNDFELQVVGSDDEASSSTTSQHTRRSPTFSDSAASPLQQRAVRNDYTLLPSAFDPRPLPSLMATMSLYDNQTRALSPPTLPPLPSEMQRGENIVLRIDNVPWDITPPAIAAWLKHPVVRVHVLLDQRAKTLSHAYVELATEDIAKAALRGVQNSVLGKGKRARGVTVTRSSQEELMRALFPSWKGNFDGSRPSLTGLRNEELSPTLKSGLMTNAELDSLMRLIRSPDSHFLKVASLPFHSLISILSKFPVDLDSRVFWSSDFRDNLFNLTYNALDVLVARCRDTTPQDEPGLLNDLLRAAVNCQAFTSQQIEMLATIEAACSSALAPRYSIPQVHAQSSNPLFTREPTFTESSYSAIAREFGVDEHLVHALAQRLGGLR